MNILLTSTLTHGTLNTCDLGLSFGTYLLEIKEYKILSKLYDATIKILKSNIHIWSNLFYLTCKTHLHFYTTLLSREYHYLVDNCSINVLGFQLQYILVPLHLASSWIEQHLKFKNMNFIVHKTSNIDIQRDVYCHHTFYLLNIWICSYCKYAKQGNKMSGG